MAEGPWAHGAAADARRNGKFLKPRHNPSATSSPAPISRREFHPSEVQPTSGISEIQPAQELAVDTPPPPAETTSPEDAEEPTSPGDKAPSEDPDKDSVDRVSPIKDPINAHLEFQDIETLPAASTGMLESKRIWR